MTIKDVLSKKIVLILAVIMVLYTLVGFFLLPILAKNIVKDRLSKAMNREVTIEKIAINPYALTATIDALVIKEKNKGTFFSVQKIFANLTLSSLFTLTFIASDLALENPYLNIIKNEDGTFNFSDFLNFDKKEKKLSKNTDKSDNKILGIILKVFHITRGEIVFTDNATKVSHLLKNLSLSIPYISTKRKNRYDKASMDIDFVLNGAKVDIHAEATPFAEDFAMQADIKTSDINVIHYLSYLPVPENILLKSLDLNFNFNVSYRKKKSNNSLVLKGNLKALNVDVKGDHEEEIIKFPSLTMDIATSDIFANQLNISKILIKTLELNLNRDKNRKINLLNYIPQNIENSEKKEIKKDADSKDPFVLNLADFEIKDAAISFQDFSNKKAFQSKLFPVNFQVINIEAAKSVTGEFNLKLETEAKGSVALNGRFQTHPVQATGTLDLSNILFNKYVPYYEDLVNFDVKDGYLDLSTDFAISQQQDKLDMNIKSKELMIRTLSIFDQEFKEEMVNIPEFKINGASIDVGNRKIDTGSITAKNGKILFKRLIDGQINLVKSVLPVQKNRKPLNRTIDTSSTGPAEVKAMPWAVTMTSFNASGFNMVFNDLTSKDPILVDVSNIAVKANDLKTFGNEKGYIDIQTNWNKEGRIRIKGSMIPSVLSAGLDIDLKKIDIKSLQPYFSDSIRILVTDGSINTKGKLKVDMGGDNPKESINFSGETSIINFVSLDKQTTKDFFKCNSLYFSGLDVSVFPVNVKVKDISLTDFYSRMIVSDTGEINLNTVFKKETATDQGDEPKTKQKKEPSSQMPQISVESVTLQGGDISFSDYLTRPNFTASMKQIAGSISGLSSDEQSRAKLHLQGLHGHSSPLDIVGTINPLAQKKFADIDISYKDIELTNFTPYSSKYLGYKIEKGKLILDLEYRVDGNKLTSENRVRFDNFELGERVDSEHATSLPVGLAISLLKNRDGQIDLDLPVTGELDDPEFKIGSIIFKMVGNLILKVVTSPFSVIGSMFGGGEELSYIEFEYGQTKISDSNYEKIDKLAQILQEKESIKLEIQGGYDEFRDAEALRKIGFEDLLKAAKLKEMILLGSSAATLKDVVIEKEEKQLFIHTAYAQAQFPKPMDAAGKQKELELEEKEKLLITNISIGKDDLRLLAMNRSKTVKAYLMSTGKVEKERIFLLEPGGNDAENTERTSKVKFLLK